MCFILGILRIFFFCVFIVGFSYYKIWIIYGRSLDFSVGKGFLDVVFSNGFYVFLSFDEKF